MKIFTLSQIKDCDQSTIDREQITSLQLMERAAQKCADYVHYHFQKNQAVFIFCGTGNNGGDGFAIARNLYEKGFDVDVFIDKSNHKFSPDADVNLKKLKELSGIQILDFSDFEENLTDENTIIIDAIFGIGLNRNLEGKTAEIITKLNSLKAHKIAIDTPSGIYADVNLSNDAVVFCADETLTFQFFKKSFLHSEIGKFCGKVNVIDIGLCRDHIRETTTTNYLISDKTVKKFYKKRKEFSHKGNYGKSCLIAGSFGKMGAAVLSTRAALKSGSGLTFTLAPKSGYQILQTTSPEAMFLNGGEDFITNFCVDEDFTCGIGPGLGTDSQTEIAFLDFLKNYNKPLVLDADALNIISKNPESLKLVPKDSIITPHPKEFERLFGKTEDSFKRTELAKEKASELGIYIVLKDHHTQIITPEKLVFYNTTGNSGLAKGGSGDVLLGIITSLLTQNYSTIEAALFGVWIHGKAGDFAAEKHGKESMLPTDVIDNIGEVFKFLNS